MYSFEPSDDDSSVAYLRVVTSSARRVAKSVAVTASIEGYNGPDVILDLDRVGTLLGIELIGSSVEFDAPIDSPFCDKTTSILSGEQHRYNLTTITTDDTTAKHTKALEQRQRNSIHRNDMATRLASLSAQDEMRFWLVLLARCADLGRTNYAGIRQGDGAAIDVNIELNEWMRRFAKRAIAPAACVGLPLDVLADFAQRMHELGDGGGAAWAINEAFGS